MFVVISYDIPNDRRRAKLAKIMLDYGERVQYSVYEFHVTDGQRKELLDRALKLCNLEEDSLRVYHLCEACKAKAVAHGVSAITEDPSVYIV